MNTFYSFSSKSLIPVGLIYYIVMCCISHREAAECYRNQSLDYTRCYGTQIIQYIHYRRLCSWGFLMRVNADALPHAFVSLCSLSLPAVVYSTASQLLRTEVGVWLTCTIRTQRQMRRPWYSLQRITVTRHDNTPSKTASLLTAPSLQITTTRPRPHPLQPPLRLIRTRSVCGTLIWLMCFLCCCRD